MSALLVILLMVAIIVFVVGGGGLVVTAVSGASAVAARLGSGILGVCAIGMPAVYGACTAGYSVVTAIGAAGLGSVVLPVVLIGVAVAVGLKRGVAVLVGFPAAVIDTWSHDAEAGCIAAGPMLAIAAAAAFAVLVAAGVLAGRRWRPAPRLEIAEAASLGSFGLVYLLRYLSYPGTYLHIGNRPLLVFVGAAVAALMGVLAVVLPDMLKLLVAATVALLGGAWCLLSLMGPCASFDVMDVIVPLISALPGAFIAGVVPWVRR